MLTKLRLPVLILTCLCFGVESFGYTGLIDEKGRVCEPYLKVLEFLGTHVDKECSAQKANKLSQQKMLRKPGVERWQIKETISPGQAKKIRPFLNALGVIQEVIPSKQNYDYILIHASSIDSMRRRVAFLEQLYSKGLRFKKVVFLVGTRKLDPVIESEEKLFEETQSKVPFRDGWIAPIDMVETEDKAAEIVWDQIVRNDALRLSNIEYVISDYVNDGQKIRRANTRDTIVNWLRTQPAPGSILAISNNPYINYQHATMLSAFSENSKLSNGMSVETVGPAAQEGLPIAIHLDNLARWLYTEVNTH